MLYLYRREEKSSLFPEIDSLLVLRISLSFVLLPALLRLQKNVYIASFARNLVTFETRCYMFTGS